MDKKEILKFCLENGLLVDKDVLNLFDNTMDTPSTKIVLERLKSVLNKRVINKELFKDIEKVNKISLSLPNENQKQFDKLKIKLGLNIEISRETINEKSIKDTSKKLDKNKEMVKINSMPVLSGKSLVVKDFVKYFKERFVALSNILQEHSNLENLVSIGKISGKKSSRYS